jgi:hypothetical protein
MNIENLLKATPDKSKEGFKGWKAQFRFTGNGLVLNTEIRYAKAESEPLIDLEGQLEKVGPRGLPVISKWEKHYYEGEQGGEMVEITENEIRYLQTQEDGSKVEVSPLQRVDTIDVQEGRTIEEVTLDGKMSYGTTITRENVDRFTPER